MYLVAIVEHIVIIIWVAYRAQFEVFDESEEADNASAGEKQQQHDAISDNQQNEMKLVDEKNTEKLKESVNAWKKEENLDSELQNLMQLQQQTGTSGGQKKKNNKKNKKKKKKQVEQDEEIPKYALPCYALDIFEDPESDYEDEEEDQESKYKNVMGNEEYDDAELAAFGKYMTSAAQSGNQQQQQDLLSEDHEQLAVDNSEDINLEGISHNEVLLTPVLVKFHEALDKCPNQTIRWQFGGEPLWISDHPSTLPTGYSQKKSKATQSLVRVQGEDADDDDDDEDQIKSDYVLKPHVSPYIPKCLPCGSARVFELQIMPTFIYQLRPDVYCHKKGEEQGMEFGTVTVYTCSGQCSGRTQEEIENDVVQIKYVKEYVHVQPAI